MSDSDDHASYPPHESAAPRLPLSEGASSASAALPAEALATRKVRVIALAQAYVSYIDTPECIRARTGESHRAWYGPELLDVITRGLRTAVDVDLRLR